MKDETDRATSELPMIDPAKWSTNDKKRIDPDWPFQLTIGKPAPAITQAEIDAMWDDNDTPIPRAVKDRKGRAWSVLGIGYDGSDSRAPRVYRINTFRNDSQDGLTYLGAGEAFRLTQIETDAFLNSIAAPSPEAAMTANPGAGFRERERIKRKAHRWAIKFASMPASERAYVRAALDKADEAAGTIESGAA